MATFRLENLEQLNQDDFFEINENYIFQIDTSANALFKFQRFLNNYKDFENLSETLQTEADREFLAVMLKDKNDIQKFSQELPKQFKPLALFEICQQLFKFWFKQTTGQDIETNQDEQTKKQPPR